MIFRFEINVTKPTTCSSIKLHRASEKHIAKDMNGHQRGNVPE